ncbi:putative sulfate transport protein CysZ [Solidesulfovibrio fructosivorans JJ]]|uniref:Putative sulfate transport protein CysZ n=1 Tax=Solidesulfovibrio fructosivorans JJ] TaxID=596151 RepID=E1JU82_SOLFR|nr:DUF3164 family protein [Solidesulfovibrio fructosivorans]EFL52012.1 putative sulfate transport protein CysZ [Solidesulfovibrio fructosivorans JJ]]
MTTATAIPDGYMEDAKGRLIPTAKVKEVDKLRDELTRNIVATAKGVQMAMRDFRANTLGDIQAFADLSAEKYGARRGGLKGNLSLLSFDGRYKVQVQISEHLAFDERLQAAKALIDECLTEWTQGSPDEIKAIINQAFAVDKEGRVNTGAILGLRRLDIQDPRWREAMEAIADSLRVVGSKKLLRVYERQDDGSYTPIALDLAAL